MSHDADRAALRLVPRWLYPSVERRGGLEIPSGFLALHFARRPTPEMKAKATAS